MDGDLPSTAAAAAEAVSAVSAATAFRHIDAARATAEWAFRVLGIIFLALFMIQPPRSDSLALTKTSATNKSSSSGKGSTKSYCQACQAASLALRRPSTKDRRKRSKAIDSTVLPFIFCAGCGSEHRAHLFSAEERRRGDDGRICAGREGRVRLCEHISFGWDEARRRSGRARDRPAVLECQHPSHRRPVSASVTEQTCQDKSVPRAEFWRGKSGNVIVRLVLEVHLNAARYHANVRTEAPAPGSVRPKLEETIRPARSSWWPGYGHNKRMDPVQLLNPAGGRTVRGHEEVWYLHDGGSQFLVSLGRCPRGADAEGMVVRLERTLVMQYGPWEAQWRSALDPWSWRRSEDVEMEGLSWCSEAGCRSHEDEMRAGRCGLRPQDLNRPARGQLSLMPKMRVRTRC